MGWSICARDLTTIRSFGQAEMHWDEMTPWKNEHTSWRSLAGRRKTHMRLVKLSQGGYECVLYNTPVVTYYPDGAVKLATHDSQSTTMFANAMAPLGCSPLSHKGQMFWKVDTVDGPHYQRGTMLITPHGGCRWTVTNPGAPETEWVHDCKKAAEVRKLIKPYGEWLTTTDRLLGRNRAVMFERYGTNQYVDQLLSKPLDFESYPAIADFLGQPASFLDRAYEQFGARTKQPVPYDRLPRN